MYLNTLEDCVYVCRSLKCGYEVRHNFNRNCTIYETILKFDFFKTFLIGLLS